MMKMSLVIALILLTGVQVAWSEPIVLTSENIEELKAGRWFVKFYAPWCGHCKHLAPTWDEISDVLKGEVQVAKVDCTAESTICSDQGVRGYPTLVAFYNGEGAMFKGRRNKEALISFARKATKPAVQHLTTSDSITSLMEDKQTFMLQCLESLEADESFSAAGQRMLMDMNFYTVPKGVFCPPTEQPTQTIFMFKDDAFLPYPQSNDSDDDDVETGQELEAWTRANRWPIFPKLDGESGAAIGKELPEMALAIALVKDVESANKILEVMEEAARSNPYQQSKIQYSYMLYEDMSRYAREVWYIEQTDLPRFILQNQTSAFFYFAPSSLLTDDLSVDAIQNFIQQCLDGQVEGIFANSWSRNLIRFGYRLYRSLEAFATDMPILASIMAAMIALSFGFLMFLIFCIGDDDDEGLLKRDQQQQKLVQPKTRREVKKERIQDLFSKSQLRTNNEIP